MYKSKKTALAVVLTILILLGWFVYSFINSTVSEKRLSNDYGSIAAYTQIVDGADYGCNHLKFKIETSPYGKSYLSVYH